jgi:hypothetical protein
MGALNVQENVQEANEDLAVCLLRLFFDLKMEALCSSETSIIVYETAWRRIPEDSTFRSYCRENLKSTIEESAYTKYRIYRGRHSSF